jgi:hypothetical protein
MTARPIFPESRRGPFYPAVTLMFVMVAVLLATGCIRQPMVFDNTTVNGTVIVNSSTPMTQAIQTPGLSSVNATPYIIINPIDRHFFGETFEINGTNNLGVNEKLQYSVNSPDVVSAMSCPTGSSSCPRLIIKGSQNITYGEFFVIGNGENSRQWTFLLNTTGLDRKSHYSVSFIINVTSQNLTIYNTTTFMLIHLQSKEKFGNATPYIHFNPIDRHFFGESFEINGTTDLGVNENLHYSLRSPGFFDIVPCPTNSSSCPPVYVNGSQNITYGDFYVNGNGNNPNQWTFLLNTTGLDWKSNYRESFILEVTSQNLTGSKTIPLVLFHQGSNNKYGNT